MGNNSTSVLHGDAKRAANRFDQDEIVVLEKIWKDLAERTNGRGIDKETFLQYFPLNGLLGDRLFAQFDTKKTGFIDFDEFILGLSKACRGTNDEKIHFIFDMYNVSHDNKISKQELSTLLNQVPKELLHSHDHDYPGPGLGRLPYVNSRPSLHNLEAGHESGNESDSHESDMLATMSDEVEEVDNYTNHDLVERAFQECDINHEGRLSYEEFKMWVERNPALLEHIEGILPYNGPKDLVPHHDKHETLPHRKNRVGSTSLSRSHSYAPEGGADFRRLSISTRNRGGSIQGHDPFNSVLSPGGPISRQSSSTPQPTGELPPLPSHDKQALQSSNRGNSFTNLGVVSTNSHSLTDGIVPQFGDEEAQARYYLLQACDAAHSDVLRGHIQKVISMIAPASPDVAAAAMASTFGYEQVYEQGFLSPVPNGGEIWNSPPAPEPPRMESYLWKRGQSILHFLSKRYYLLNGNCLFYYSQEADVRPKGVIFLTGSLVGRIKDEDMELKGYYGFELLQQDLGSLNATNAAGALKGEATPPPANRHVKRVLYCRSEDEREKWVTALQHAAQVVPIEDDYVIGKEVGRGRFSVVCECVNKTTGKHCAVKIIDKATIEPEEKQLLRTEIAVLKLVNHPNIIRLEGVYESKAYIYIVMEILQGGELFQRIVGRPRFSEAEAAKIIRPLLEAIAYIHDLGIVHRDIKPENILCGESLEDLKIADFGLSKMILPKEKMDNACGTLSYVAPEVLTMQGYGKEADLWSVGVIMFLLLCGKLPFDGDDHNEIIRNTIQADLKPNLTIWGKLTEEAKSLMNSLLNKNPKDRITAREALKHPFIVKFAPKKIHHGSISGNSLALHNGHNHAAAGDHSPHRATSYADSVNSDSHSETDLH